MAKFHATRNKVLLKEQLGFVPDHPVLGTVIGNLRPVKDLPTLLKAFAKAKAKRPSIQLSIVGNVNKHESDGCFAEAAGIIRELGIEDSVHFAGAQTDVAKYVQAIDIYVSNSLYEGMSNTLLEAMACKAAIVATKVGGTPFIVRHGYNGLLVPSASPEAMSQAILRMLEEPLLREELTSNGLAYVKAKHRLDLFVAKHERIYQEEYLRKRPNATLANASVRAVLESEFEN